MSKRGRPPADVNVQDGPISEGLRRAVESNGASKYALAKEAGISKPQFYRFLKGERDLSQAGLNRLASRLGVRVVLPDYDPLRPAESQDSAAPPATEMGVKSVPGEITAPDPLVQILDSLEAAIDEEFASLLGRLAGHEAFRCEEGTGIWDRFTRWWRPSAAKGDVGLGESPTDSTVDGPASTPSLNRRVSLAGTDPTMRDLLDDLRSSLKMRVRQTLGVSPTDIDGERPNDQGAVVTLTRPVQAETAATAVSGMGHRQADVGPSLPRSSSSDLSMAAAEATDPADPNGSGVTSTSPGHATAESGARPADEGRGGPDGVMASEPVLDAIELRSAEGKKRTEEAPLVGSEPDNQPTPNGETRAAATESEAGTPDPVRAAAGSMPIIARPTGKWVERAARRKQLEKEIRAMEKKVKSGVPLDPNAKPVAPMPEPEEESDDDIDSSWDNYEPSNINAALSTRRSASGSRNAPWAADIRDFLKDKPTSPYLQELADRYGSPKRVNKVNSHEREKFYRFVIQLFAKNPYANKLVNDKWLPNVYKGLAAAVRDPDSMGLVANHLNPATFGTASFWPDIQNILESYGRYESLNLKAMRPIRVEEPPENHTGGR